MCIHMHTHVYIYIYTYVYIYMYVYVHIRFYMYVYVYANMNPQAYTEISRSHEARGRNGMILGRAKENECSDLTGSLVPSNTPARARPNLRLVEIDALADLKFR